MSADEIVVPTGTLKQVKLSDIKVGDRFRKDFDGLEDLIESIRELGVLQPITLSKDLTLLAGERRLRSAIALKLDKIPALLRAVEGEADMREIELVENIHRKDFTWQERTLLVERIDSLYKEKNQDWSGRKTAQILNKSTTDVARSLTLAKMMKAIPELAAQPTAADAGKLLKKFEEQAIVEELRRRQDVKVNTATVGQTTDGDGTVYYSPGEPQVLRLIQADKDYRIGSIFDYMGGDKIDVIECDPPYGIDLANVKASKDSVDSTVHGYEEVHADDYQAFLKQLSEKLYEVAADNCWLIFWFGPTWHYEVRESLKAAGWHVDDIPAIWQKLHGQTISPEIYLARCYEPFFLCRKGSPVLVKRGVSNVFDCLPEDSRLKYHPTQRPTILIKKLLETVGLPGQNVFVPFLGSGATLRACYEVGMNGFGYDLDPKYKDKFMLAVEQDFIRIQAEQANKKE